MSGLLQRDAFEELEEENKSQYLDKILNNGLNQMTELELKEFDRQYKDFHLPNHRLYAAIPFNVLVGGFCFWYTINIKKISKKYFKPKKFGFKELMYYGTIQSVLFVAGYSLGTMAITGLWNPVQYARDIAKIQGTIIDNTVKHDKQAQKYLLYNFLEYFDIKDDLMKQIQTNLDQQKQELIDKQYFSEESIRIMQEKDEEFEEDQNQEEND